MRSILSGLLVAFLVLGARPLAAADPEDYERALADYKASYEERLSALEAEVAKMRGELPPPRGEEGGERSDPPILSLRGFGQMQYAVEQIRPRMGYHRDSENQFALGDLDLFITSQIAEDVTFLNELLFEFLEDGENRIDVERLLLRYQAADWFVVSAGRSHTALGYWNQRYHHGTWLQATADRPLIFEFEDEGGILPMHFVGIELGGTVELGQSSLSYAAALANGRGRLAEPIQLIEDEDDSKLVSLSATLSPFEDFGFGFTVLSDRIPAAPDLDPSRRRSIDELIYGGHVFYQVHPYDLVAELVAIRHDDQTSGSVFDHYGGYVQLGRAFGAWMPYYRYDFLNIGGGDPFYMDFTTGEPMVEDTIQHTLGLRWNVRSYLALKAEYRLMRARSRRAGTAVVQASFAF
jgi:hypothetical protein